MIDLDALEKLPIREALGVELQLHIEQCDECTDEAPCENLQAVRALRNAAPALIARARMSGKMLAVLKRWIEDLDSGERNIQVPADRARALIAEARAAGIEPVK